MSRSLDVYVSFIIPIWFKFSGLLSKAHRSLFWQIRFTDEFTETLIKRTRSAHFTLNIWCEKLCDVCFELMDISSKFDRQVRGGVGVGAVQGGLAGEGGGAVGRVGTPVGPVPRERRRRGHVRQRQCEFKKDFLDEK